VEEKTNDERSSSLSTGARGKIPARTGKNPAGLCRANVAFANALNETARRPKFIRDYALDGYSPLAQTEVGGCLAPFLCQRHNPKCILIYRQI
jgi:hypothetical protein